MKSVILSDAQAAPTLFLWNGPVERRQIEEWIRRRNWGIPPDLIEFWRTTGGGTILESERLLPPPVAPNGEDEVAKLTAWCQGRGMPGGLVVFHEGLGFTAVRSADGTYVSFDGDVRVRGEYADLDDWYIQVLRAEYARRYALPPLL